MPSQGSFYADAYPKPRHVDVRDIFGEDAGTEMAHLAVAPGADTRPANVSGTFSYLYTWDPRNAQNYRRETKTNLDDIFCFADSEDEGTGLSEGDAILTGDFSSIVTHDPDKHKDGDALTSQVITSVVMKIGESEPQVAKKSSIMKDPYFLGNVAIFLVCVAITLVFTMWHIPEADDTKFMSYLPKYDSWVLGTTYAFSNMSPAKVKLKSGDAKEILQVKLHMPEQASGTEVWWNIYKEESGVETDLGRHNVEIEDGKQVEYLEDIDMDGKLDKDVTAFIKVYTNSEIPVAAFIEVIPMGNIARYRIIISGIILAAVYILIGLEKIHRTLVALVGAFVSLLFLTIISHTPSMARVIAFMDEGTLSLLFGMMVIVATLSQTGVFEWIAVRMVIFSSRHDMEDLDGVMLCNLFKLTVCMCIFSGVVSAFLDNVTTLLLLSPVTIRLCEMIAPDNVEKLAIPLLISNAVFGNVGGTMTLIGTIPNVIIGNRLAEYVGFIDFIINLAPAIILMTPFIIMYIRYRYKEALTGEYQVSIEELKKKYPIKEPVLLTRAGMIACFVVLLLFLHPLHHQDSGWVALCGAMGIMLLGSNADLHHTLLHVEWDTLLFFAGLFVMIAAMAELGLIRWIGDQIVAVIMSAPKDQRLMVGILIILWVSSITSGFLSNIAFAATMVPVIKIIGEDPELDLPMPPLAWALSFGTCLGGNLTLVGSAASLVAAGVAEHNGMHISFYEFGKTGVPVWLMTTTGGTLYMLIVYVWFGLGHG